MTINLDDLERLAKAAGGQPWAEDGYIIFEDIPGGGEVVGRVDIASALCGEVADFMAAANPAAILEFVAEVRRLRERLEIDPRHPYDGIYCRDATIRGLDGVIDDMRSEAQGLQEDAERWRTEMALRNDPTVAIMFAGTENRCSIYRGGKLHAFGETYAAAIDAARKEKA
jgi:hypothetical protein